MAMTPNPSNLTLEDLRGAIQQLSPQDLITLFTDIEERLQTAGMMELADSGFQEWNDDEESIYDVES
jgi:hypothetical protein